MRSYFVNAAYMPLLVSVLLLGGCSTSTPLYGVDPDVTARREVTEEMPGRAVSGLSVKELLEVSGSLASDLSSATVIQEANHPVVIEILRLEDQTAPEMRPAPQIYAATIRERLLNSGQGTIAFRDRRMCDRLYADVVAAGYGSPAKQKEAEASLSRLAKVDYYLSGLVYTQNEINPKTGQGFRYYRIHFLLTDAATGLIAWERHYDLKDAVIYR